MRRNWIIAAYAATTVAGLVIIFAVGCGGGGGSVHSSSSSAAFASLLPAGQRGASLVGNVTCAKCHATECTPYASTIHSHNLVTCENCHGPGSVHALNPQTTNILTYPSITSDVVCAQCHTAQDSDWSSSPHGTFVADPVDSGSSTCERCHSANFHDQYIDSPLSQGVSPATINTNITALTSTVLDTYETSTTATATCANCHDPHQTTSNLPTYGALAGTQLNLRDATANTSWNDDGVTAASLTTNADSIGPTQSATYYTTYDQLCGRCHNARGANPADSALRSSTSRPPFHEGPEMDMLLGITGVTQGVVGSSTPPASSQGSHYLASDQCIHCHMPNGSHTFTINLDVSCVPCHSTNDAAAQLQAVQTEVLNDLVGLQSRLNSWAETTYGAANSDSWDYTSNIPTGETVPTESTVPLAIQEARYNYYFVVLDRSNGVHNAPYAEYLLTYANEDLDSLGVPAASPRAQMSIAQMKAIIQPHIDATAAASAEVTR